MLRARAATEDAAAQRLAVARRDEEAALQEVDRESERLDAMSVATSSHDAPAFLAAAAAHSAAAATYAAAFHRSQFAAQRVVIGVQDLNLAAQQRRTVEKLAERIAEETQRTELSAAQRELDDVTITRFGRDAKAI
jgi:1-aminocyclopropane-1-carboxylate deaminase/D-cysteine desulfhydrase-like pyridoxal-dependent ACC family enzyme